MTLKNILFTLTIFSFFGCLKTDDPLYISKAEYFNSFETEAELKVLEQSNSHYTIVEEAAPNGGVQSLHVSGGCIIPHVSIELGPYSEDREMKFRFWGKTISQGIVGMRLLSNPYPNFQLLFDDSDWTQHESVETLFVPANEKFVIDLISGGVIPGGMEIDMLEIFSE